MPRHRCLQDDQHRRYPFAGIDPIARVSRVSYFARVVRCHRQHGVVGRLVEKKLRIEFIRLMSGGVEAAGLDVDVNRPAGVPARIDALKSDMPAGIADLVSA